MKVSHQCIIAISSFILLSLLACSSGGSEEAPPAEPPPSLAITLNVTAAEYLLWIVKNGSRVGQASDGGYLSDSNATLSPVKYSGGTVTADAFDFSSGGTYDLILFTSSDNSTYDKGHRRTVTVTTSQSVSFSNSDLVSTVSIIPTINVTGITDGRAALCLWRLTYSNDLTLAENQLMSLTGTFNTNNAALSSSDKVRLITNHSYRLFCYVNVDGDQVSGLENYNSSGDLTYTADYLVNGSTIINLTNADFSSI